MGAPDYYDRFTENASDEAERRQAAIQAEIATLPAGHWAGSYYGGELGAMLYLDLAPNAGFVFQKWSCFGVTDLNWGEVREVDGRVRLEFHFSNSTTDLMEFAPIEIRHYNAHNNKWIDATVALPSGKDAAIFTLWR